MCGPRGPIILNHPSPAMAIVAAVQARPPQVFKNHGAMVVLPVQRRRRAVLLVLAVALAIALVPHPKSPQGVGGWDTRETSNFHLRSPERLLGIYRRNRLFYKYYCFNRLLKVRV